MTDPTQKKVIEFWEWCGLDYFDGYFYDGGARVLAYGEQPDLNLLFKYAVPKVWELCIDATELYEVMDAWLREYVFNDNDPALALFQTLNKVREVSKG